MGKSVLVTGAAGFMGSHVARHCLQLGMSVVAVDDLSGGFIENVPSDVKWVRGDLTDVHFVKSLWKADRFDYVYHLAAYAAEGLSHFIRLHNYQVNLLATVNLINEAVIQDTECFVFTSSIAVYGQNQTPMDETMVPCPEDPYGVSKYAVELDLRAANSMFGMDWVVFRPHNVYGERQNIADTYRNVVGIFMNQVLGGDPMTVFGDGTQTRAFTYIDDVAPVIARAPLITDARNEVFNIGSDTPVAVNELAEEVAAAFGVQPQLEFLPARNEVVHAFANHEKLKTVFPDIETTSLRSGIQRMATWARRHGPSRPITFDNIEVRKNLPPSWNV